MALPHVVLFPFMAQGHTLPLLDLAKALSHRRIKVTVVTTPANAAFITAHTSNHPNISVAVISFPAAAGLPAGCENSSHLPSMDSYLPFLLATKHLRRPFEDLLARVSDTKTLPICVVSDFFLGWTLASCRAFGVPRLVFHGMGVLSMAIAKTVLVHAPHKKTRSCRGNLDLPGLEIPFVLTAAELPEMVVAAARGDEEDPFCRFMSEVGEAEAESWGVVVNSFLDLEKTHVPCFESFYKNGAKAWCIGPLSLYDDDKFFLEKARAKEDILVKEWLDERVDATGSVIYVSFGTQTEMSFSQLDEVAHGLDDSGFGFVFVVRARAWSPPDGMEERIKGRGVFVRGWVDQRRVLAHGAVGGFMSHCGWNSVLESLCTGVPILAWPMMAEQSLNAKFVVEGLGAGLGIREDYSRRGVGIVSRCAICESVKELMGGEKGRSARERARALGREAARAVQDGGSSSKTLNHLIARLSCASN